MAVLLVLVAICSGAVLISFLIQFMGTVLYCTVVYERPSTSVYRYIPPVQGYIHLVVYI